jgi:hypothetical protein
MALIDLEEFKDVLGVGDIYPDATLEEVMAAAENILLQFLTFNKSSIYAVMIRNNVGTYYLRQDHAFAVGQTVTVTGCLTAALNGNKVVTAISLGTFQAAAVNADVTLRNLIPSGSAILQGQESLYDQIPECRQGALMIAVDIWNARQSASGQAQAVDFNPGPYRMGRSLLSRVVGLVSAYRDTSGMVG